MAIAKTVTALACAAGLAGPAFANTFPAKPITFVVPYPAGGASDVFARLIAERLQASLKQTVVVENRTRANGIIAYQHVAKAPADGYTILMANIGPSAINPSLYKKLPYDAMKDFAPVTMVSWVPLVVVANPGLGVSSVPELIAKVKASPGELSYGVSGISTPATSRWNCSSPSELFGKAYQSPFGISPVGLAAMWCYRGDVVLAAPHRTWASRRSRAALR
jgi:tripartite-type tricarboxylate transporter receptor subunit TctC